MKKFKSIEEAAQLITDALEERNRNRAELKDNLETVRAARQEAAEKLSEAFKADNSAAYHEAQDAHRSADDAVKLYEGKLRVLDNNPVFSERVYEDINEGIIDLLKSKEQRNAIRACAVIDEFKELAEDQKELFRRGNELMQILQHDLQKDDACITASNGKRVHIPALEHQYNKGLFVSFVNHICGQYIYANRGV